MAKETLDNVDLTEETKSAETSQKSEESSEKKTEVSETTDTTKEETQEEKKGEEKSEETTEDDKFTLTDVEVNDKGQFVWKVDPSNPKTTVYVGDTLNDLMKNVAKGITDKDTYIGKLKTQTLSADSVKGKHVKNEDADDVANPNIDVDKIYIDVAKEYGIDPKMFSYTPEQWRERETEVGAVNAMREANRVEQAVALAQQKYSEANIDFINDRSLDLETAQAEEVAREMGLEDELTPEKYEEILTKVYDNKDNFRKNGLRKPGVVVKEVVKYMVTNFKEKASKQISAEKDEKIAASRLQKEKIRVVSKTKSAPVLTEKAPKDLNEALEQVMKTIK